MTDAADDFDALFEEVAAQRASAAPAPAAPAAAPAAQLADEDDLDALFDQVAASTPVAAAVAAPAPAVPAASSAAAAPSGDAAEGEGGNMYERLGGIVRLLHDSLRELGYDRALKTTSLEAQIIVSECSSVVAVGKCRRSRYNDMDKES